MFLCFSWPISLRIAQFRVLGPYVSTGPLLKLMTKSAGAPAHCKRLARNPIIFSCREAFWSAVGHRFRGVHATRRDGRRSRPTTNPAALGHSASAPHFGAVRRADGAGATRL